MLFTSFKSPPGPGYFQIETLKTLIETGSRVLLVNVSESDPQKFVSLNPIFFP